MRRFAYLATLLTALACQFAPAPAGPLPADTVAFTPTPYTGNDLFADNIQVSGVSTFLGDTQLGTDYSDTLTIGASWNNDLMFKGSGFPFTIGILTPPPGNNGGVLTVRGAHGANADATHDAGLGGDFILGGAKGGDGDATHPPKAGSRTIIRGGPAGGLGIFGGEAFGGDILLDPGPGIGRDQHGLFTGIDGALKLATLTGRIVLIGRGGTGPTRDDGTITDINGIFFQAHGGLMLQPEGNDPRTPSFIRVSNGPFEITARGTDGSGNYNGAFFPLKLFSSSLEIPLHTLAEAAPPAGFVRLQARTVDGVPKLFVIFPGGTEREIAFVEE